MQTSIIRSIAQAQWAQPYSGTQPIPAILQVTMDTGKHSDPQTVLSLTAEAARQLQGVLTRMLQEPGSQ